MTPKNSKFPNSKDALFSVGLIADPQHADVDDGWNHTRVHRRRFRRGLDLVKNAVKKWNEEDESAPNPTMIICLGDIIDGRNKAKNESAKAMENMLKAFGEFEPKTKLKDETETISKDEEINEEKVINSDDTSDLGKKGNMPKYPYFHNLIGNHELYNFDRIELMKYLYNPTSNPLEFYYSVSPHPGFVFIFLDGYVLSVLGYGYVTNQDDDKKPSTNDNVEEEEEEDNSACDPIEESKRIFDLSTQMLEDINHNDDKNVSSGLEGDLTRFVAYNGGFGEKQLQWFAKEVEKCHQNKENVFLFSHMPLSCAWDYDKIRAIIDQFRPCVKMVFSGHNHSGGLTKDNGVWDKTLEGAIESHPDKDCFGTAYFYDDRVFLKGFGMVQDDLFPFQTS